MDRQRIEIDQNYDAFQRILTSLLPEHRNRYALMREREMVGLFDRPGDAYDAGCRLFTDGIFSIQEVTDEPIDLGFFSHVAH
jgi:hypothetical protein